MSDKLQRIIDRYDWMEHEIDRLKSFKKGTEK
jgi:hypothetical protein